MSNQIIKRFKKETKIDQIPKIMIKKNLILKMKKVKIKDLRQLQIIPKTSRKFLKIKKV